MKKPSEAKAEKKDSKNKEKATDLLDEKFQKLLDKFK